MLFVSFPAADVAADAVHKLTNSSVDSKELFIKVLPNIHVSSNSNAALFINGLQYFVQSEVNSTCL